MLHTFSARVLKVKSNIKGTFNPCVVVPEKIVSKLLREANRKSVPVQVRGTLNGKRIEANVVRYGAAYRLYLNAQMRQSANVAVGDMVAVSLAFDPQKRTLPVPTELKAALAENKEARAAWGKLPPFRRKEFLSYLNSLKTKGALERNVERTISILAGK